MKLYTNYLELLTFILTFSQEVSCQSQVITPEVSILDEAPSIHTGRVISWPNRSVEIQGLVGEKVVLQCNVFNMPRNGRILWQRESLDGTSVTEVINDGLMSRDMSRWKIGQGKQKDSVRLEILSLDSTYEGIYSCECQYTGSVEAARVERILRVFAESTIVYHMSSYNTDADVGDPVVLRCAAEGIPPPFIYWQRASGASSIIRNYGLTKNGNEIRFEAVQADDAGEYVCFAENSVNRATWRVRLQVRYRPIVRIYPDDPSQKVGCKLRLFCSISANPPVPEMLTSWTSNQTGTMLQNSPGTKIQYLNAGFTRHLVLDLEPVLQANIGQMLTCSATNIFGVTTASVVIRESPNEVLLINGRHACDRSTLYKASWSIISIVLYLVYCEI